MPPINSGVYSFKNLVNGKRYVGASVGMKRRKSQHLTELRRGTHQNPRFQNAWNKYGEDQFVYEILQRCPKEECIEWEAAWILIYEAADPKKGYNICPFGISRLGVKVGEEGRRNMSEAQKKRLKDNPEELAIITDRLNKAREGPLGRRYSKEHGEKISRSNMGRKVSEETRQKLRDYYKESGGFSKEAIEKRNKALASPEVRAKMSAAHKGVPLSESHREAVAASVRRPEVRKKISDSLKARHQRLKDEREST